MNWLSKYETGIKVIDDQNKKLVGYVSEMENAGTKGDAELINHVLEGLINHAIIGFEIEEELLEQAGYPLIKGHRRMHELFMKRLSELRSQSLNSVDVSGQIQDMLKSWVDNHIMSADKDYAELVKEISSSKDNENQDDEPANSVVSYWQG